MKPGIYSLSSAAYHADELGCDAPCLSASIASILLRDSPKHAYAAHPLLGGGTREESETFDLGTAAHAYILEGDESRYHIVDATYLSGPRKGEQVTDWTAKGAQEQRDVARAAGKIPMLPKHIENVRTMSKAVRAQLAAFTDTPAPLTNGKPEQVLVWFEPDHGVWCKSRLDWLHDDYSTIDDLKTTTTAQPDAFTRALYGRGGDLQAAMYLRGLKAITGVDATFRYIVAENSYPFAVSVCALGPEALAHASDQVEQAIQKWAQCLKADHWPGYPTRTCYLEPPAWAIARFMESADPLDGDPPAALASSGWERS